MAEPGKGSMADAGKPLPTTEFSTEVAPAGDRGVSMDISGPNAGDVQDHASQVTVDDIEAQLEREFAEEDTENKQPPAPPEGEAPEAPQPEAPTPEVGDLGEYSPERAAEFEAKYTVPGKEGLPPTLNKEALSAEFWAGQAAAGDKATDHGHMNESTYAWLEDSLGLDRETIYDFERGQTALRNAEGSRAQTDVFAKVGITKEVADTAIAWGAGGGYSDAQKKAFNEAMQAGGARAEDAMEALMGRYRKANPEQARRFGRRQTSSTPQRTVSGGGGGSGAGDVFASREEHGAAFKEALAKEAAAKKSGDRAAVRKAAEEVEAVRAKARRSKF